MASDPLWSSVVSLIQPNLGASGSLRDEAYLSAGAHSLNSDWSITSEDPTNFPYGALKSTSAAWVNFAPNPGLIIPASTEFTVEWEAKYPSLPASSSLLNISVVESNNRIILLADTSGTAKLSYNRYNQTTQVFGTTPIPTGVKVHIAVERSVAGVMTAYINGVSVGTYTDNVQFGNSGSDTTAGGLLLHFPVAHSFLGQFRLTKGVRRYGAAFTSPTGFWPKAGTVAGVIKDQSGEPISRVVRAYDRTTGRLSGAAVSNPTTGAYTVHCSTLNEHEVIMLDDSTGILENDQIARSFPSPT